jgi:type I restriction enzyme, S subunit
VSLHATASVVSHDLMRKDLLPTGWDLVAIRQVATVVRGASPRPAGDPRFFDGDHLPWITVADLTRDEKPFLTSTATMLTREGTRHTRILEPNTVLLTNSGATLGVPKITRIRAGANDGIAAFLELRRMSRLFLYYVLQMHTRHFRERIAPGVGQPNLNTALIGDTIVPVPPKTQQRAIVRILLMWDKAIVRTSRLIRAKIKLKRGLMQQLLTGQRRFPEFASEQWREVPLGDLFTEREETERPDLSLLSITADRGVIPRHQIERKDSSNEDKSLYRRIAPGDIGYNTMRMWQGVSALSQLEGIVSPAYTVCIPSPKVHGPFAAQLFKFTPTVHRFRRYSQGLVDDTLNLKFHEFAQIRVALPSVAEQKRIAAVLTTLDRQIETLITQQSHCEAQKRGLMQKLLTGQVRVKV